MKKIIANACVFIILAYLLPGVAVSGMWGAFWAAIVYAFVSGTIGSLLKFFAIPFNWLSFGLVNFLLNGFILYLTSSLTSSLTITSFPMALVMGFVLALVQGMIDAQDERRYYSRY